MCLVQRPFELDFYALGLCCQGRYDGLLWTPIRFSSNYTDACGYTKVFKGEAWSSDATYPARDRKKETLPNVNDFFERLKTDDVLRAFIVFDGNLCVQTDFDLHLHFDHPIKRRSLLIKNISRSNNPLTVIDSFS